MFFIFNCTLKEFADLSIPTLIQSPLNNSEPHHLLIHLPDTPWSLRRYPESFFDFHDSHESKLGKNTPSIVELVYLLYLEERTNELMDTKAK